MPSLDTIESRLYEHVLGEGQQHNVLLNTGVLTTEWTDTYLQLLKEAVEKCQGRDFLPRDIVAAVHFASWYLNIRYDAWRAFENGRRNEATEHNLGRLRTPSEYLLLSAHVERGKAQHRGADITF
jgi:hypothetical protein